MEGKSTITSINFSMSCFKTILSCFNLLCYSDNDDNSSDDNVQQEEARPGSPVVAPLATELVSVYKLIYKSN